MGAIADVVGGLLWCLKCVYDTYKIIPTEDYLIGCDGLLCLRIAELDAPGMVLKEERVQKQLWQLFFFLK